MEENKIQNKIDISITDFKLHARTFRSAQNLAGSVKENKDTGMLEGRFYSLQKPIIEVVSENRIKIIFPWPEYIKEKIKSGEIVIDTSELLSSMGLLFSKDAIEKLKSIKEKNDRKIFNNTRIFRKV